MNKDTLFNKSSTQAFTFDTTVSRVFNDMAQRSIPGYDTQQRFIAEFSLPKITKPNSIYIDLGCSTGTTFLSTCNYATSQHISLSTCTAYMIDYSFDMIQQCNKNIASVDHQWKDVHTKQLDMNNEEVWHTFFSSHVPFANVIVLHFVLQFIHPNVRYKVLRRCWDLLTPGGIILLGEKVRSSDTYIQNTWDHMYYTFKKSNGYSDEQIINKRTALEGVLVSDEAQHLWEQIHQLRNGTVYTYYSWGAFQCYILTKTSRE